MKSRFAALILMTALFASCSTAPHARKGRSPSSGEETSGFARAAGLRRAENADYRSWIAGYAKRGGAFTHVYDRPFSESGGGYYVATKDFKVTPLYGKEAITIIVPENVRMLGGDPGLSTILYMKDFDTSPGASISLYNDLDVNEAASRAIATEHLRSTIAQTAAQDDGLQILDKSCSNEVLGTWVSVKQIYHQVDYGNALNLEGCARIFLPDSRRGDIALLAKFLNNGRFYFRSLKTSDSLPSLTSVRATDLETREEHSLAEWLMRIKSRTRTIASKKSR